MDSREKHRKLIEGRLKRLALDWPDDLWLFATGDSIHVMERNAAGERAMTSSGGVDPDYELFAVAIDIDGGDW